MYKNMNVRCQQCHFFRCICIQSPPSQNKIQPTSTPISTPTSTTTLTSKITPTTKTSSSIQSEQEVIQFEKQYITGSLVFLNQQLTTLRSTLQTISDDLD